MRREINDGLNVVENWNSANAFIFYGKGGEVATNRLEEQELSVLSLHLLQICLVYVNTLMIQSVLEEQSWSNRMLEEDLRALSPLIYNHVNPYGIFELRAGSGRPDSDRRTSGSVSGLVARQTQGSSIRNNVASLKWPPMTASLSLGPRAKECWWQGTWNGFAGVVG